MSYWYALFLLLQWNTMAKKQVGTKGFIWLTLPRCCSQLKEVRTGTQTGQNLGGRSWCRGHGGLLLFTGLLHTACLAHLLIEPRTTSLGLEYPTMGWVLPHLWLNEKMPYSWSSWRHFLSWGSFLWWLQLVSSSHTKLPSRVIVFACSGF